MQPITPESVIRRHPDAAYRVIDGTAVIVNPHNGKLLTLNAVGTHLWGLLGEATVAELATAVTKEFEVAFEPALQDTLAFLGTLSERGMLVNVSESP